MAKVKHIALMKFKEGTSEEQIDSAFDQLLDLTENVDGVEDYVSGTNNSPLQLNKGFTHAMVVTFSDVAARDAYLAHGDRAKMHEGFLAILEDLAMVDFEI